MDHSLRTQKEIIKMRDNASLSDWRTDLNEEHPYVEVMPATGADREDKKKVLKKGMEAKKEMAGKEEVKEGNAFTDFFTGDSDERRQKRKAQQGLGGGSGNRDGGYNPDTGTTKRGDGEQVIVAPRDGKSGSMVKGKPETWKPLGGSGEANQQGMRRHDQIKDSNKRENERAARLTKRNNELLGGDNDGAAVIKPTKPVVKKPEVKKTDVETPKEETPRNSSSVTTPAAKPDPKTAINQEYDRLRKTDPAAAKKYGMEQSKKMFGDQLKPKTPNPLMKDMPGSGSKPKPTTVKAPKPSSTAPKPPTASPKPSSTAPKPPTTTAPKPSGGSARLNTALSGVTKYKPSSPTSAPKVQ